MIRLSVALAVAFSSSGQIHFTDVAPKSSFIYITKNDLSKRKYFVQPMAGGVAIFDYDNDGKQDIFWTNGANLPGLKKTGPEFFNCLLRNRGDGTFEDVTEKAGLEGKALGYNFGVAVGDYDNDGYEDLFVTGAGRNTLYRNNGNGTFTDVTANSGLGGKPPGTLSVGAAWFDYDNDGLLDLVVSNYTAWTPETDKPCATETQTYYCTPVFYNSVSSRLYHNLGHGRFEDVTERSGFGAAAGKGMGVSIADFNGDGLPDVLIGNDTEANALFVNKGHGLFEEQGLQLGVAYNDTGKAVSTMGTDANDFDNDGRVDVLYNDLSGQLWGLFRNRVDGFQDISAQTQISALSAPYSGWSIGFIDYDDDGWKDIYSANGDVDNVKPGSAQHDTLFRNLDGQRFVDVSEQLGNDFLRIGYQRGAAFGDLNNDGFPDVVTTSLNDRPRILLNSADNGNHWIGFVLRGIKSNRDAIGATVKITTVSGRTLYNRVNVSVGFMSSSDKRVLFGLGAEASVKSVEIRWPSGIVQRLADLKPNTYYKVSEAEK